MNLQILKDTLGIKVIIVPFFQRHIKITHFLVEELQILKDTSGRKVIIAPYFRDTSK